MREARAWFFGLAMCTTTCLLAGGVALSCGDDAGAKEGSTGGGGSTGTGAAPACAKTCESKVTACGGTADQARQGCGTLCQNDPTQDQVSCLGSASCDELAAASDLEEICPGSTTTTTTTTTTSSTSSGCPTPAAGVCELPRAPARTAVGSRRDAYDVLASSRPTSLLRL